MMGSKGDNTLIWIIIAVIAGILLFYFLWSRGLIPVFGEASRAQCEGRLITACDKGDRDQVRNLWKSCKNAYKGDSELENTDDANLVCQVLLARAQQRETS